VDTLITDRPPEPACREALAEAGVNLLVAEGGEKGEENGKA
jgi:hypothetical protein